MKRIKIKELLENYSLWFHREVTIKGWIRTRRESKNVVFLAVNDGSTIHSLQCVFLPTQFPEDFIKKLTTGSGLRVTGQLIPSPGSAQPCEIKVDEIELYGTAPADEYPLQKKGHTLEFLREIAHLRPRTNTFGAVFRIRHHVSFAIHKYFNDKGFFYFHTPIITGSDCEGAGAMFRVTTLPLDDLPRNEEGKIDFSEDFFGKETKLTVSGQLEGELGALALGEIYTFGPTFRAENSNTPRHLSEFWMIEPEMAFYDLEDNMNLAEDFLKFLVSYTLETCGDDLAFLQKMYDAELFDRLQNVIKNSFVRITYTEAIKILEQSQQPFEFPIYWGADLQSEHERFLVEKYFKSPVILTDYPKEIKAFYMKLNDDGKTVRAMDILFPRIGEIIGGSQREDDYEKLLQRVKEMHIPEKDVWWYLETRKFGSVPHSGFGLGLERFLLFVTGMSNIRDVIPFPRTPHNAEF
ncbi:MAG: asparagine--tRNA ligase [Bacteroidales bacterium]|nr:asparagine--tRNA ligase [Bacteroidales bacterium]